MRASRVANIVFLMGAGISLVAAWLAHEREGRLDLARREKAASDYVDALKDHLAAKEVWMALGVSDRIGATEDHVMHCSWSEKFTPDLEAYLDKFLLGKTDGKSTEFLRSKFTGLDTGKWIPWTTPELKQ